MASKVAENFYAFCEELRIKNSATISGRASIITRRLNSDFWSTNSETAHSWYVGSYGRKTGIVGISDIDFLMQLPYETFVRYNNYSGNGQSALLQAVRNSIANTYSSTKVGGDGQVVVVAFADNTVFEILPAFLNKDDISFTYPDSNAGGSWKSTNPLSEIKEMRKVNNDCNKNLRRLCRMSRCWKQFQEVPITGFLIDTLACSFLPTWSYRDKSYLYYDYLVRDFFQFLSNRNPSQEYWYAPGSQQRVYRTGKFEKFAANAYSIAVNAIEHEAADRPSTARNKWRELFGNRYP